MFKLKKTLNRFDRLMAAITFAEADEPGTALSFLSGKPRKKNIKRKRANNRSGERTRPVLRV